MRAFFLFGLQAAFLLMVSAASGATALNASQENGGSRKGSFMVLGDWGHDPRSHGNLRTDALQRAIAAQMLAKFRELGDVKFIINVGDSFYPTGITSKSDPKWQSRWRNIYAEELQSVPWYSVYGNHDYHDDWGCACGEPGGSECNQVNYDASNRNFFNMPGVNYFVGHPELNVEIIGLDYNVVADACHYGKARNCFPTCMSNLGQRAAAAKELFKSRVTESALENLLVFSHYPTDYLGGDRDMMYSLANTGAKKLQYFGGHRHSVDQTSGASIAPNTQWLVGGGGGWGCDSDKQGFVVGEITDTSVNTYAVLVDQALCKQMEASGLNASRVYV